MIDAVQIWVDWMNAPFYAKRYRRVMRERERISPERNHQKTPLRRPMCLCEICPSSVRSASQVPFDHGERRAECPAISTPSIRRCSERWESEQKKGEGDAPSELDVADLLAHPDLPLLVQLVPETKQRVHKGQIEAVLWSVAQLGHGLLVALEPRPRGRLATGANVRRELAQVRDREG